MTTKTAQDHYNKFIEELEQEKQMEQQFLYELEEITKNNHKIEYETILLSYEIPDETLETNFQLLYLWNGKLILSVTQENKRTIIKLETIVPQDEIFNQAKYDTIDSSIKKEIYTRIYETLEGTTPIISTINYEFDETINDITTILFDQIADIKFEPIKYTENQIHTINQQLQNCLKEELNTIKQSHADKISELIKSLLLNLKIDNPKLIELQQTYGTKPQRILGKLLAEYYGIVLRRDVHTIYREDDKSKGYRQQSIDDLKYLCSKIIGENIVTDNDITDALTVIDYRIRPEYNKIHFKNGIYDIQEHKMINPVKPVFTLLETNYNYNPNAKSRYLKHFLETSLEKMSPSLTADYIEGVLQVVGYLFTSGNPLNTLIFIVGIRGGGKSLFSNILTNIFNKDKDIENVSHSNMNELGETHGTAALENSALNIAGDSSEKPLSEDAISVMKKISGNDNLLVNPKFRNQYTLYHKEVCKLIIVLNQIGFFTELEESIISRFILIEFDIMFRGTEKEDTDLESKITNNPEEIEWLIYNGLKAYEKMIKNKEDFKLRLNTKQTKELINKHSNPINHILKYLILKHDPQAWNYEVDNYKPNEDKNNPHVTIEELSENIQKLSIILGIDIKTTQTDKISGRKILNAIREEFDLFDFKYTEGEYIGESYGSRSERILVDYDTVNKKFKKKLIRHYPDLIKNNELWEMLGKIELDDLRAGKVSIDTDKIMIKNYIAKLKA